VTRHRFFNVLLAAGIVLALTVLGPALDDPHESPAEAAQQARNTADGQERLLRVCRAKHGPLADVEWTASGPSCRLLGGQRVAGGLP
jgi:hypothetical protein